jgi:hypothetical protein
MDQENNSVTTDNGKNAGIISYITIIGWLIAYFAMHNEKKTELGSYQLRQTLLFYIVCFCFYILWGVVLVPLVFTASLALLGIAATLSWIIYIALIVFWVIGFIGAVNGQKKPIPFIGEKAQTMFPGI